MQLHSALQQSFSLLRMQTEVTYCGRICVKLLENPILRIENANSMRRREQLYSRLELACKYDIFELVNIIFISITRNVYRVKELKLNCTNL